MRRGRADEPAAVLAERGRFALVEGRVLSVRESGGTVYLNFGRRWTEDFTVTIAKRNERTFAAAGLEPKRLERLRIRVRGFVEERGGPWIEASAPGADRGARALRSPFENVFEVERRSACFETRAFRALPDQVRAGSQQ